MLYRNGTAFLFAVFARNILTKIWEYDILRLELFYAE